MSHKKVVRIDPLTEKLPAGGVDSHAHLDSPEFADNLAATLERAQACGVSRIGNVFLNPRAYELGHNAFPDEVFFLLGIHPCDGLQCTPECLEAIESIVRKDSRIRAIGEIGLDFHWDDCPRELQMQAFARQLELASRLELPVVIHCREAEQECLTLLEAGGFKGYPLLWHCFGGNASLARRIIANGWHLSIPGPVTYPANRDLREALKVVPDDRLLLETDCPYLSPVPWRGVRNEPAFLVFTCRAVAEAKEQDPTQVWQTCGRNSEKFFALSPLGPGTQPGSAR